MSALIDLLTARAAAAPDTLALVGREDVTLADLMRRVEVEAEDIQTAVPGTAPVALALPNGVAWVVADLALPRLRRLCVPLPPFFSPGRAGS